MKYSSLLNESQEKAVLHTNGPLLILAGAGSGKTRVITYRIAHLIEEMNIPPQQIFAVTFTNKAAAEMKNRVINLTGPQGNSVFMRTFHSAAVYILRRYGEYVRIPRQFSIYDQSDQETLVKQILLDLQLDPKKIRPGSVVSSISSVKEKAELIEGADLSLLLPDYFSFNFEEVYRLYHERMAAAQALDFNDLLIKTVQLLRDVPEIRSRLQSQWRYFMVDEYQDTNYSQYLITKYLASETRNLCVVGDDDQSIYSWRGADIRNILDFEKDYPEAEVVVLNQNYRSREPILAAAAGVISNNTQRKEKTIEATRGDGEPVLQCQCNNEYGEAEFVINTLSKLKSQEGLANRDFAIFYRTNAQSRIFEDYLRRESIPYRVVGGLRFYDRKEIKDLLAYLRFINNPADDVALFRIINTPTRGIGSATLARIRDAAAAINAPAWRVIEQEAVPGKTPAGLKKFREIIIESMEMAKKVPEKEDLGSIVEAIVDSTGYRESLDGNPIENASRIENIDEFISSIYNYGETYPEATLDAFLQDISLLTSEEGPEKEENSDNQVTLMTVHNAKGLEFPVVFLTGMEENTFPHKFSIDTEEGIEEERRLCYVGITRAMERVFLTSAELRRFHGTVDYRHPSRFLNELPPHLVEYTTWQSQSQARQSGSPWMNRSTETSRSSAFASAPSPSPTKKSTSAPNNDSQFSVKEHVLHPKFGPGQIVKIEGTGDNVKLTINFAVGKKSFLEKYTPLQKLH